VPGDGAVAVIVSAVDAARDLARRPVLVEAAGTQIIERIEWDQSTLYHEPQVLGQAAHLWSRTSLRPGDVDVAELYDGFTFNCLSWIEGLGFCGIGEAGDFLDGGKNIARDGLLPLNTHGGQLSHGRTHGMAWSTRRSSSSAARAAPGRCPAPGSPWSARAASRPAGSCCCGPTREARNAGWPGGTFLMWMARSSSLEG
jgi:hypothetical protein